MDQEPIPNAHVVFHSLTDDGDYFGLTDSEGGLKQKLEFEVRMEISFVGFKMYVDTILPGESKTILLEPDRFGLDEVVVTAQYVPESERNSVYRVKVLGSRQIESRAAVNVADLLANQLNIRLSQDNASGTTGINLMGLGGENVKILMDGVPLVGRLNGVIDLNQVNLNNIERVEIIEGPVSVSYGSNALGGVINLISKSPESNRMKLDINSYYESVGQYNFDGLAEFSGTKDALQLSGGRNFFGGFSTSERNRGDDWNMKEQFFGKVLYRRRIDKGQLRFSSNGFLETIKDKGEINNQNLAFDNHYVTTRLINELSFNRSPRKDTYYEAFFAYSYYERKRNAYVIDMETLESELSLDPAKHDTSVFHSIASRGNWSSLLSDKHWSVQLGYDVNYEKGLGKRIRDGEQDIADLAAFGSLKWNSGRWVVQPALRLAYNTKYDTPLIPSLNLKYNIQEDFFLRFSYARGFRAPSLKELYLDFVDANHNVQGNDSLLAERSHSFTLSSASYFGKGAHMVKIEPSLWFNYIEDRIQLVYTGPGPADYTNANIGSMVTTGGKIQLFYEFHPRVNFSTGYAIMALSDWSQASSNDFFVTNEYNATLSYISIKKQWSMTVFYKWTGETPRPAGDTDGNLSVQTIPSYQMLDLTLNKRLAKDRIVLNVGAKNLFDVTNLDVANSSGGVHTGGGGAVPVSWGRTYFVGLKIQLDHAKK